jgi:acyl carrier protein
VTTSQNPATSSVSVADITATLTDIVAAELGVAPTSIRPDTNLRTMEGADSVKVLRTVAKIERAYDIELEDEDVFGASSVAEIAKVVHRALEAS